MTILSGPELPPASGTARQLVVVLHGYGADGQDLIGLGEHWRKILPDALFVAPNAHEPCGGAPFGFQWFALDLDRGVARLIGSQAARPVIGAYLDSLWARTGLGPAETVLVGFSQGAMMALDVGLRLPTPLLGIVAFSGMVIAPETLAAEIGSKPPVALIHGEEDPIVPVEGSLAARKVLEELGVPVTLHLSPGMPHTIAPDGLDFATRFLDRVVNGKG